MSKMVVSQKMEQKCDACGKTETWEVVAATTSEVEVMIKEMQEWFIVGRKVLVNGQMTSLSADACCLACVPVAAVKLALPEQPADNIDLAALQQSTYKQ